MLLQSVLNRFQRFNLEKANAKPKLEVYTGRTAYKNIHLKSFIDSRYNSSYFLKNLLPSYGLFCLNLQKLYALAIVASN